MTNDLVPTLLTIFDMMIGHPPPTPPPPPPPTPPPPLEESTAAAGQRQFPVLKIVEPGDEIGDRSRTGSTLIRLSFRFNLIRSDLTRFGLCLTGLTRF